MQQRIARHIPAFIQIDARFRSEIPRARLVPFRAFRLRGEVRVDVDHRDLIFRVTRKRGDRVGKIRFLIRQDLFQPRKKRVLAQKLDVRRGKIPRRMRRMHDVRIGRGVFALVLFDRVARNRFSLRFAAENADAEQQRKTKCNETNAGFHKFSPFDLVDACIVPQVCTLFQPHAQRDFIGYFHRIGRINAYISITIGRIIGVLPILSYRNDLSLLFTAFFTVGYSSLPTSSKRFAVSYTSALASLISGSFSRM